MRLSYQTNLHSNIRVLNHVKKMKKKLHEARCEVERDVKKGFVGESGARKISRIEKEYYYELSDSRVELRRARLRVVIGKKGTKYRVISNEILEGKI